MNVLVGLYLVQVMIALVCVDMVATAGRGFVETAVCTRAALTMTTVAESMAFGVGHAGPCGTSPVPHTLVETSTTNS